MTNETKPQNKLPTSMRYERVQGILESQPAICGRLGPKTYPIETRFGEKVFFSKEAVEITEALHNEGKDAHKVPLNDVLRMAARVMMRLGDRPGGAMSAPNHPPSAPSAEPKRKKVKSAPEVVETPPPPPPEKPVAKREEPHLPLTPPAVVLVKKVKVVAGPPKPVKAVTPVSPVETAPKSIEESTLPESELPPEKQPLKLPPDFDPAKYPHYSVQSSIYSLLLSALNMSEHYERFPNAEDRQKKLDELVRDYQDTCDPLKFKS